jgi:pimeloyl-ACP methyl ester carboxylesterase
MNAQIEPVTGHYMRINFRGKPHRIYYEDSGQGIPLICLHTAGSDTRQYRGVQNDPEVLSKFRVVAFDMPWHGKSSPPPGFEKEFYSLDADLYMDTIWAVADALGLEKPVIMGCSMGGRVVLHLAMKYPRKMRAVIGLQSGLGAVLSLSGIVDESEYMDRSDVNSGEAGAALNRSLIAPHSPEADTWETLWHYMQSGVGVFKGDLDYYFAKGDLRNGLFKMQDPKACPMYLLTGEYDWSASPEITQEILRGNPEAKFQYMKELGHFPMSENPKLFLEYLHPVLKEIVANEKATAAAA